jgi:hypothetical protein
LFCIWLKKNNIDKCERKINKGVGPEEEMVYATIREYLILFYQDLLDVLFSRYEHSKNFPDYRWADFRLCTKEEEERKSQGFFFSFYLSQVFLILSVTNVFRSETLIPSQTDLDVGRLASSSTSGRSDART